MEYLNVDSIQFTHHPLWWHTAGKIETPTGYGNKLTTPYKVLYKGRLRRVYASCFSNVSTMYILVKKIKYIIRDSAAILPNNGVAVTQKED